MDWNEIIKTLGAFGISASLIISAIVYLAKKYIEHGFQHKLEQTKQDFITETEKLKLELANKSTEYQIKISHLHKEQVDAVKSLYSKLAELNHRVYFIVIAGSGDEADNIKVQELHKLFFELKLEFMKNKILYNSELSNKIGGVIEQLGTALFKYTHIIELSTAINNPSLDSYSKEFHQNNKRNNWDMAAKITQDEVPVLLSTLESEFRRLLGISLN